MQCMSSTMVARRLASGAVVTVLLAAAGSQASAQEVQGGGRGGDRGPIVIQKQGSFFVGGTTVTGPGTFDPASFLASDSGQTHYIDHLYAQYQIPPNARRLPLVMVHGGGQMGKTWESTPDNREGYQTIFLRRGYSVYIVDFPRRARAGYPSFQGHFGTLVDSQVIPDSTRRSGDKRAFNVFRLGVWPDFFPNVQFPRDSAALEQYFRQIIPSVQDDPEVISDALAALFDKIGPAVLLTHSQSGLFGWLTAIKSSNVKAIISYEPVVFTFPEGEVPDSVHIGNGAFGNVAVPLADFEKLTRIPIQIVYGDNIPSSPTGVAGRDVWYVYTRFAEDFRRVAANHGGDVSILHLPDAGLHGNTHFPFSDLNNVQVANLLSHYLHQKGLDRRGGAAASRVAQTR